jgi:hypothetical protein
MIFLAVRSPDAPTITTIQGSGVPSMRQDSNGIPISGVVVFAMVALSKRLISSLLSITIVFLQSVIELINSSFSYKISSNSPVFTLWVSMFFNSIFDVGRSMFDVHFFSSFWAKAI